MSRVFGHLESYFLRDSQGDNSGGSRVIYQDIERKWKEMSKTGIKTIFATPVRILMPRDRIPRLCMLCTRGVNIQLLSDWLKDEKGGRCVDLEKIDTSIQWADECSFDIDSTGSRIVYIHNESIGVVDVETGKLFKSLRCPKIKEVKLFGDRYLLVSSKNLTVAHSLPKPIGEIEGKEVLGLLGEITLIPSTEFVAIEDKYLIYLSQKYSSKTKEKLEKECGIEIPSPGLLFFCSLQNPKTSVPISDSKVFEFKVFKLDHSRWMLVGVHNHGYRYEVQETSWIFSTSQLEEGLADGKLQFESVEKADAKYCEGDEDRVLPTLYPVGYDLEEICPLGILDVQREDLRKEIQNFLVEQVRCVPTDVLGVITMFIVS